MVVTAAGAVAVTIAGAMAVTVAGAVAVTAAGAMAGSRRAAAAGNFSCQSRTMALGYAYDGFTAHPGGVFDSTVAGPRGARGGRPGRFGQVGGRLHRFRLVFHETRWS